MCENSLALSISKASGTFVTPTLDRLYQVGKVAFNLLTSKMDVAHYWAYSVTSSVNQHLNKAETKEKYKQNKNRCWCLMPDASIIIIIIK